MGINVSASIFAYDVYLKNSRVTPDKLMRVKKKVLLKLLREYDNVCDGATSLEMQEFLLKNRDIFSSDYFSLRDDKRDLAERRRNRALNISFRDPSIRENIAKIVAGVAEAAAKEDKEMAIQKQPTAVH